MSDRPPTRNDAGTLAARVEALGFWPWAVAVAALALAVYSRSLRNSFVYDDVPVLDNEAIRGALSLARLLSVDTSGDPFDAARRSDVWRPLTTLSLALDWRLGGGKPWIFHATNALLHALASTMVLRFAWGRLSSNLGAVAAASVFAAHTLNTDAVSAVAGRADVLALLGAGAVYGLHGRARGVVGWAPIALLLGVLCKETVLVALPLVALRDARDGVPPRAWPARYGGYALALAVVTALRAVVIRGSLDPRRHALRNPLVDATLAERAVTAVRTFGRAARLTLAPLDLLPDYAPGAIMPSTRVDLDVALGALALGALAGIAAWGWRRKHALGEAALWALVTGLAAVNVPFLLSRPFAERWWYVPSAAACVIFGAALGRVRWRLGAPAAGFALAVTVAALSSLTVARQATWSSSEWLLLDAALVEPRSAFAQVGYGELEIGFGAPELALARCQRAAVSMPRWSEPWGCMAKAYERLRRLDDARGAYAAMRAREEVSVQRRAQYASFLGRTGRRDEALREFDAIERDGRWSARVRGLLAQMRARVPPALSR